MDSNSRKERRKRITDGENGSDSHYDSHRNSISDTLDELTLLILVFATFGLIYAFARKPDTRNSKIHSLFKYFDFFEPRAP